MNPSKYLLTKADSIHPLNARLFGLQGWKKEILELLLSKELKDSEILEELRHVVSFASGDGTAATSSPVHESIEGVVTMLPERQRKKAGMLATFLLKQTRLTLNESGHLVFPEDGMVGSTLYDVVNYFTRSAKLTSSQPSDVLRVAEALLAAKAPKSMFSPGKEPQTLITSSVTNPVAVSDFDVPPAPSKWLTKVPRKHLQ